MRSTAGEHYIALDHVRALAAFLVFAWHFLHYTNGYPVPFEYVPLFPFSIVDEGHTGVALFMALSGYLFAKLLDGKRIHYRAFLWNRMLRLAPLLAVTIALVGIVRYASGESLHHYWRQIGAGLLKPTLPNGGWSITVELHFYLLLPALLWLCRKSGAALLAVVALAIALRALLHHERGEIQSLAYLTLVGRLDQFLFGMLAYHFRGLLAGRHALMATATVAFLVLYWAFDRAGGFYLRPSYPSPSRLWIVLPTIEGIFYALAIAYYDNSFNHSRGTLSRFAARIGDYSYAIYLLHFFVVFHAARFIHETIMDLSNFYVALAWAALCFLLMMPIGYLSARLIEMPFLRLRRPYVLAAEPKPGWQAMVGGGGPGKRA